MKKRKKRAPSRAGRRAPNRSSLKKQRKTTKAAPWKVALGALTLAGLTCGGALFGWSVTPTGPSRGPTVHFQVREGVDRDEVVEELTALGLVESPGLMKVYLAALVPGVQFARRTHLLVPGSSPRQLVARLAELDRRPVREVTLVEGWNLYQVARTLEEAGICSRLGFEAAALDADLLQQLAIPGHSAEGYLFPARYPLRLDSDPHKVVVRLVEELRRRLRQVDQSRHPDLDRLEFTEHDVVTLASIVEKETGKKGERARIARVFLNRLLLPEAGTSGRLQSDPTAAYGCITDPLGIPSCAEYDALVTPRMLKDKSNPYNTYRRSGLPPGPISNPGEAALRAVLHPAEGRELYFVADGQGGHRFSETYEDHRKGVDHLRQKRAP